MASMGDLSATLAAAPAAGTRTRIDARTAEIPHGFYCLLLLVLLLPLPIGSVSELASAFVGLCTAGLLIHWCVRAATNRAPIALPPDAMVTVIVPFALIATWGYVQTIPVSPTSWHHPLWQEAAKALGQPVTSAIALTPDDALTSLMRLLSYGAIFWLALQYGRDARVAKRALQGLVLAGLAYAAYGLFIFLGGNDLVLWYDRPQHGVLSSTFVNRNNYATYAGLGLLAATAVLIRLFSRVRIETGGPREQLKRLVEALTARGWIVLLAWLFIATALLLTKSRGGFVSTLLGLATLVGVAAFAPALNIRAGGRAMLPIAAAGLFLFIFSGDQTAERLAATTLENEDRLETYATTVQAIRANPWFGYGLGSFEDIFRHYRPSTFLLPIDKAHSDVLETMLDVGIVGIIMFAALFAALFTRCLIGAYRRQRDAIYPCLGAAATVLVVTHAAVDFSLQIPAVAGTYAFLMGITCAQSWSHRRPAR